MKKEANKDNSFGTASVVLGILSVTFSSAGGIILGVVGLVFALQQRKINENKWSKSGFILGIVGIILGIVAILLFSYMSSNPEFASQFQ